MIELTLLTFFCPIIVLVLLFFGDSENICFSKKLLIIFSGVSGLIAGYALSPILFKGSFISSFIISLYQVLAAFGIFFIFRSFTKK